MLKPKQNKKWTLYDTVSANSVPLSPARLSGLAYDFSACGRRQGSVTADVILQASTAPLPTAHRSEVIRH